MGVACALRPGRRFCLIGAGAVAHKAGTTGYATISIAGQTVRYAKVTLPEEGVLPNASQQDLRNLAAALARHLSRLWPTWGGVRRRTG